MSRFLSQLRALLVAAAQAARRTARRGWHAALERRRRSPVRGRASAVLVGVTLFAGLLAFDAVADGGGRRLSDRTAAAGRRVPAGPVARSVEQATRLRVETTTTTAPVTTTTAAPAVAVAPPPTTPVVPRPGAMPVGKGMWIWLPEHTEGGDPNAIVAKAVAVGLSHLYVRTGSSWMGFHGAAFMDAILPVAHAAGLRVYGWDFPNFADVNADLVRAIAAIDHTTPGGHKLDGFSPDIETGAEGTNITAEAAEAYGLSLRNYVGPNYPMIATVPRPSPSRITWFPYANLATWFDGFAPMVYWLNREPYSDVAGALQWLAQFGKPVMPVGQAYDGGPEGGRPGPPPAFEIDAFLQGAEAHGALGVSFWSWQAASQEIWDTLARAPQFTVPTGAVAGQPSGVVRSVQVALAALGYPVAITNVWDEQSWLQLVKFQLDRLVHPSGVIDATTRSLLLGPVPRG